MHATGLSRRQMIGFMSAASLAAIAAPTLAASTGSREREHDMNRLLDEMTITRTLISKGTSHGRTRY